MLEYNIKKTGIPNKTHVDKLPMASKQASKQAFSLKTRKIRNILLFNHTGDGCLFRGCMD